MISTLTLKCGETMALAYGGRLGRQPNGVVELRSDDIVRQVVVESLGDEDELWVADQSGWFCAVGERDRTLLVGSSAPPSLEKGAEIPRLDFSGSYDPGGLYRVEFFPVSTASVLVETEVGLCLVRESDGVLWTMEHDDLTMRVDHAGDGEVALSNENGRTYLSLSSGQFLRSTGA